MSELTDRMRTCAAYLGAKAIDDLPNEVIEEAAKLLVEAATELEKPIEVRLGTLMEPIPPSDAARVAPEKTVPHRPAAFDIPYEAAQWIGDDLKPIPNAPVNTTVCPKCDSRTQKTVRIENRHFKLECPVCGHAWRR